MPTGISIVMPAYNASRFLVETVNSVLRQTYQEWELLIVNDGSTDSTEDLILKLESLDPRICHFSQPNQGVAIARNNGYKKSSREFPYVMFFDSDDVLVENALEVLAESLEADRSAVAAHGMELLIDEYGTHLEHGKLRNAHMASHGRVRPSGFRIQPVPIDEPTEFDCFTIHNPIITPGLVLLRKAEFDKIEGFDPATSPCEDRDLWLRILADGHMSYVRHPTLKYRRHSDNVSHDYHRMLTALNKTYFKASEYQGFSEVQKKAVARGYRLREVDKARIKYVIAREAAAAGNWRQCIREVVRIAVIITYGVLGLKAATSIDRARGLLRSDEVGKTS